MITRRRNSAEQEERRAQTRALTDVCLCAYVLMLQSSYISRQPLSEGAWADCTRSVVKAVVKTAFYCLNAERKMELRVIHCHVTAAPGIFTQSR